MELGGRIVGIAAVALGFGLVVFVHELGHYVAARLSRMTVHEFSIGFGRPLLFWFKRRGTQYSFRLWPFFSYVRIAGMEPGDDDPAGFHKRSRLAQAFVLAMGCVMNVLLGAAIFIFIGMVIGKPLAVTKTIDRVMAGTPAERAGLLPGDRLIGVAGRVDMELKEIQEYIQARPEEPIVLEVERDGERLSIGVTPARERVPEIEGNKLVHKVQGRVGVAFRLKVERMGPWESIGAGFIETYGMVHTLILYLIRALTGRMPLVFVGPVGVVDQLYREAKVGWLGFLSTSAALTVGLGVLNLLPIPPLDGSRLAIVGIEAVRRKPFDKRKEVLVHLIGFALLLGLVIVLTYNDIVLIMAPGNG